VTFGAWAQCWLRRPCVIKAMAAATLSKIISGT
jgi:hypothetical protein